MLPKRLAGTRFNLGSAYWKKGLKKEAILDFKRQGGSYIKLIAKVIDK